MPENNESGPSVAPGKGASSWPLVGIVPELTVPGWKGLGKPRTTLEFVPLDEALQRRNIGSDCCLVSYFVPGQKRAPRLNKGSEKFVRGKGADVLTGCMVMDYDLPKGDDGQKQELTRALFDEFLKKALDAAKEIPELNHPHVLYQTRHGVRMIWVYDEPVPVEQGEAFAKDFHQRCLSVGLEFDEAALDWTRLSRLPYAPEGLDPDLELTPEAPLLRPKAVPSSDPRPREVRPSERRLMPNDADVANVLGSEWWDKAREILEPTKYYDPLFSADHGPLVEPGGRDSAFTKFAGAVVHYTKNLDGTTPTHVYAVLHFAAEAATDSCPEGEDWCAKVWDKVQRLCDKEEISHAQAIVKAEVKASKTERMLQGVREWCRDSSLAAQLAGPNAMDVLRNYMAVVIAGTNETHLMTPKGYYDKIGVRSHSKVLQRVRELGMTDLIPIRVPRDDGKGMKTISENDFGIAYGTTVENIEARAAIPGNFVRKLGTDNATLILKTYELRKDLEPHFDEDVDEWLKHFFGKHYDEGVRWIAHALDLESPIAGLSMKGPPDCGKKLLSQGLAECIDTEEYRGSEVFGQWNRDLQLTPFVVVNEGLPATKPGEKPFADRVKDYIGGDRIMISTKNRADRVLLAVPRIIFTANDHEILNSLAKGKDMTPEARRSLAQRLIHFDLPDDAGEWLAGKGGMLFTGRPGRRWIRSDVGKDSDYVVAKHFLWLYENRDKWPAGTGRLLVEGDPEAEWTHQVALSSGSSAVVVENLCNLLAKWMKQDPEHIHEDFLPGILVDREQGKLYATAAGVRKRILDEGKPCPSSESVGRSLIAIAGSEGNRQRRLRGKRMKWTHIDLRLLLDQARKHGYGEVNELEDLLERESVRETNDQGKDDGDTPF